MRVQNCAGLYWHLGWLAVLAANLVVPGQLGWEVTRQGGRGGLAEAVLLLWAGGHMLLVRAPVVGEGLVAGGLVTAVTQLYPLLQVMAGVTSLWVIERAAGAADGWYVVAGRMTGLKAFAATLLTAAQVGVVALVCGPVVRAVASAFRDVAAGYQPAPGPHPSPNTPSTAQQPRT